MPILKYCFYIIGSFNGKFINHWLPIQKGIVVTTGATVALVTELLNQEDTKVVFTHFLGSDSIESYFGTLRHHTGPRASAHVVMLSMRSLMLSKINKYNGSLAFIRSSQRKRVQFSPACKEMAIDQLDLSSPARSDILSVTEKQALYYISGFIVRRITDQNSLCVKCKALLTSKPNGINLARWEGCETPCELPPPEFFTFQRNFGGLVYVSYPVFNFLCEVAQLFSHLYDQFKCSADLLEVFREQILLRQNILPWLPQCNCKLPELLIDYAVKPLLNAKLNEINRFDGKTAADALHRNSRSEE